MFAGLYSLAFALVLGVTDALAVFGKALRAYRLKRGEPGDSIDDGNRVRGCRK